jgi:hypothetical protein
MMAPRTLPDQAGILRTPGSTVDTALYTCQNLSVPVGGLWPDQGGAVVGFSYADWSPWNRAVDPFVSGWTTSFQSTTQVVVRSLP